MKSIELFAGIGGIALAAEWAGIETIAFCEREPYCQRILKKHWPDTPIFDDIRTLNKKALEERGIDVGAIELVTGGFPCQPFSSAGKRLGKEDDRDLWPEMFRVIKEIRPNWVVGENVANFVNMELERTVSDLESEGYTVQSFLIPAVSVNAKHNRSRCFVVAHTEGERRPKEREYKSSRTEKWAFGSGEIVANASSKGLQRSEEARNFSKEKQKARKQFAGCGYERGAQWEPEPDVGGTFDGVSSGMDGGEVIATKEKKRPYKILQSLRQEIGEESYQRTVGRPGSIQEEKILHIIMCEFKKREADKARIQLESTETFEGRMRSLWHERKFTRASHGSGYNEQYSREYTNTLQVLSRLLAQYSKEKWEKNSWGNAKSLLNPWNEDWENGVPRVAHGVPDRVDRLKALGNAVVPQQIYPIFEAIRAIELE